MADFFQNGVIGTLHNLNNRPIEEIESELMQWSSRRPMALILPSLFSELEGPALEAILDEIQKIPYLEEIIIGLDRADEAQYRHAKAFFSRLPQRHTVLWNDGPRLRSIDELLKSHGLAPQEAGKGRNVWYCFGYFLASGRSGAVALHDCDILTYKRDMVAKLMYPLVHPSLTYAFCKGYYYRAADGKLNGRVSRMLVSPLVRALKLTLGSTEYLDYVDSFRYPLAGEFSMLADVVPTIRIPSDWGLEIGVMSEIFRRYPNDRICQIDVADRYDHKHQELSPNDASAGLHKMSTDIAKALFRKLAIGGVVFTPETFRTIKASYYRIALDHVDHYHADALLNGYSLDRHAEEKTVELFAQCVLNAGQEFLESPMEAPFMPSWSRVVSAVPDIYERLIEAVDADSSA